MPRFSFLAGIIGGLSIFLPGILLVFFVFPLWKNAREMVLMKHFLKGVSVTVASLILMTAIKSTIELPVDYIVYIVVSFSVLLLLLKKIPAPLIVIAAAIIGFII